MLTMFVYPWTSLLANLEPRKLIFGCLAQFLIWYPEYYCHQPRPVFVVCPVIFVFTNNLYLQTYKKYHYLTTIIAYMDTFNLSHSQALPLKSKTKKVWVRKNKSSRCMFYFWLEPQRSQIKLISANMNNWYISMFTLTWSLKSRA